MAKHLFKFSMLLAVVGLIAGCTLSFVPPLPINDLKAGFNLAIAVDPQGTKHIIGVDPLTNQIVYLRTRLGETQSKVTVPLTSGWWPTEPDIGVVDDGTAILAWYETDNSAPLTNYRICFMISPSPSPPGCGELYRGTYTGSILPVVQVVAGGSKGSVIYSTQESGQYHLYYHQAIGGTAHGKADWSTTNLPIRTVNGVIDSAGYLHLIWYAEDGVLTSQVLYASNRTTDASGNMTQNRVLLLANSDRVNPPAIAIYPTPGGERVAFAYVKDNSGSDDEIYHQNIKVDNTDASVEQKLNLTGGAYQLANVHAVGVNNGYLIGFIRKNTVSSPSEVWLRNAAGSINQITTNSYSEEELQMVAAGGSFVMAYKRVPQSSEPRQVFIYEQRSGERLIYSETCGSYNLGGEMAASGDVVAGVWAQCDRVWFSTNAELVYLPLLLR
jgi:hypothetical protein